MQSLVKYGVTIENFGPNASQIPHTPPWPLEQRDAFEPPIDPTRGFWLFANENGRVRAFVSTRSMQDFAQGGTFLHWRTQLTKQPNQVHTFTLNRSWLRVNGVTPGPNGEIPEASLWFSIVVEVLRFDVQRTFVLLENRRAGSTRKIYRDVKFVLQFRHQVS